MRNIRHIGPGAAAALALALAVQPAAAQDRPDRPDGPSYRAERFISIYDTNGDGKVTIDEITAEQKRLFGAVDVDRDGALSVDEFRRRGRIFQTLGTTTLFDLLDVNGDRKVTAAEIAAPSSRWFKRYDANGDGAMVADEIPSWRWHRSERRRRHR